MESSRVRTFAKQQRNGVMEGLKEKGSGLNSINSGGGIIPLA